MGKKHKHPEHENLERWLVSYADFITLLFATFVVLYALSQADLAKFKQFSQSVKQAFSPAKSIMQNPGGVLKGNPNAGILKESGNSILDKFVPKDPGEGGGSTEGKGQAKNLLVETIKEINQQVEAMNKQNTAQNGESIGASSIKVQERGVVISLSSGLFFEPASAGLKPASFKVLNQLAELLKKTPNIIHVEGHTDNQPMTSAIYPSNWELSTARASSVVRYFISRHGVPPERIAAVGYGDTRPIADNTSREGRQKNRRVDIVILSSSASSTADAGVAQTSEQNVILNHESQGPSASDHPEHSQHLPEAHKPAAKPEHAKPSGQIHTAPSSFSTHTPQEPAKESHEAKEESPAKPNSINIIPEKPNIFRSKPDTAPMQEKPNKGRSRIRFSDEPSSRSDHTQAMH